MGLFAGPGSTVRKEADLASAIRRFESAAPTGHSRNSRPTAVSGLPEYSGVRRRTRIRETATGPKSASPARNSGRGQAAVFNCPKFLLRRARIALNLIAKGAALATNEARTQRDVGAGVGLSGLRHTGVPAVAR